ncbi:hypothetical protein STENM223S_10564 [Streptomyces tendae]
MAGQVFVMNVVIVLLLVVAAAVALVLQVRHDSTVEARNRSVSVAATFANSPGIREALRAPDPSAVLQPRAEAVRRATGVDFVVVTNPEGIRYTHPKPDRIGKKFVGNIEPALAGETVTEEIEGTIGPLVQAIVPVEDPDGKVVGTVSAGITTENVGGVADRQLPLVLIAAAVGLALATGGTALVSRRLLRQTHGLGPHEMTRMYEHHDAVLHSVREGVLIVGAEGRLLLSNDEARRLLDLPADAEGRPVGALGLPSDLAELLASGQAATDEVHLVKDRLLAINQRPTDVRGGPAGSVATLRDSTELRALSGRAETARERLDILYAAGVGIGTSLDVTRTAEELGELAVPRFADYVSVDLFDTVLAGGQPGGVTPLRRAALSGITGEVPLYPVGHQIRYVDSSPQARALRTGRAVLEPRLGEAPGWQAQDHERSAQVVGYGVHSLITVPLRAGSLVLGVVCFWRSVKPEPFDEDELALAEELVARAAVSIDNARRYTREHSMAVTLQRSLLPRRLPDQNALDVAYRYLPAQAGVGGDWFDVLPLSGARVALVVGDVVGHGLHAAATMGRLRTAVHNFTALDGVRSAPGSVSEHVLALLLGLPCVALGLLGASLGRHPLVADGPADRFLGLPLGLLRLRLGLLIGGHSASPLGVGLRCPVRRVARNGVLKRADVRQGCAAGRWVTATARQYVVDSEERHGRSDEPDQAVRPQPAGAPGGRAGAPGRLGPAPARAGPGDAAQVRQAPLSPRAVRGGQPWPAWV